MHEKILGPMERFYDDSMVNLELDDTTTWCKSDSGVRQGSLI